MKIRLFAQSALIALFSATLFSGCYQNTGSTSQTSNVAAVSTKQQNVNIYTGSIVGTSYKAKTISITTGKGDKAKTVMVRFDDRTTGLEFAEKNEAAIITWEQRGAEKFAVRIQPKTAQLPEGVSEIKVDEMFQLIDNYDEFTLVDSRPESRFAQAHLPGAVSVSVARLQEEKTAALPKDKDRLLIFYCGGYT